MMVTATVPGPGADSCANARVVPPSPTTAMSTAIQRVMTALLFVFVTLVISRAPRVETIGQECDSDVVFVCDVAAHQRNDIDLVLLDDVEIGLEDTRKLAVSERKLTDNSSEGLHRGGLHRDQFGMRVRTVAA